MNGLELRARRERLGASPNEVAERVGVDEGEIREWERTDQVPRKHRHAVRFALWEVERDRIMDGCGLPRCEWMLSREENGWAAVGPEALEQHTVGCSSCRARHEYAERHVPPAPLGGGVFPTAVGLLHRFSGWRRSAVGGALLLLAMGGIGVPVLLIKGIASRDPAPILGAFALFFTLVVSGAAGGIVHYLTTPLRQQGRIGHYAAWILTLYGYLATVLLLVFLAGAVFGPEWGDSRLAGPGGLIFCGLVAVVFGLVVGHVDWKERAAVGKRDRGNQARSTLQMALPIAVALFVFVAALMSVYEEEVWSEEDWQQALPELEAAARDNPDDAEAQLSLGYALLQLNRRSEALPLLQRAVELAPEDADARNSLGWTLNQFRRFADAVPVLQEAVRLEPDHPYAHHNLGWALINLRRLDEAERAYTEAVRVDPDEPGIRTEYAQLLLGLRRLDTAAEQFRAAIRLQPTNPDLHGGLAVALMQNGKPKEAMAAFREAARLDPDNPMVWSSIGGLAHLTGEYEESDAAFQRVSELHPTFFEDNEEVLRMWQASKEKRQYTP